MNVGITFDLKQPGLVDPSLPDDAQEEFDSPHTIEAIATVLRGMGHHVTLLGDGREFLEKVLREPLDWVFNFAEGTGISRSREARVPAVLDMLGIPYTGSDPLTMAVTLDKDVAKTLVAAAGVRVPGGYALPAHQSLADVPTNRLRFPLVVKPAWEGSSKGIRRKSYVTSPDDLPAALNDLRAQHPQTFLLEEYIPGDELTVAVLGNDVPQAFGAMRVLPRESGPFIYSVEIKRDYRNRVDYDIPPSMPANVLDAVYRAAETAFAALGCRDVARVDFRVHEGVPYFLEVNPLPGLNPDDSDLVILAKGLGWTYERLIRAIVDTACARFEKERLMRRR